MTTAHVDDGVLLALIDGERRPDLDAGRTHVASCADCRARMTAIARNAERAHAALLAIPVPPAHGLRQRLAPPRVLPLWRRPSMQATAALIALAAVAAAGPVRHWIERRALPSQPPKHAPSSLATDSAPLIDIAGATVAFDATSPDFTFRLDSLPADGAVSIERSSDAKISARVTSGAGTGGDAMLIIPSEVRVANTSSARASYVVAVPSSVLRVRIVMAGKAIFDGLPPARVTIGGRSR